MTGVWVACLSGSRPSCLEKGDLFRGSPLWELTPQKRRFHGFHCITGKTLSHPTRMFNPRLENSDLLGCSTQGKGLQAGQLELVPSQLPTHPDPGQKKRALLFGLDLKGKPLQTKVEKRGDKEAALNPLGWLPKPACSFSATLPPELALLSAASREAFPRFLPHASESYAWGLRTFWVCCPTTGSEGKTRKESQTKRKFKRTRGAEHSRKPSCYEGPPFLGGAGFHVNLEELAEPKTIQFKWSCGAMFFAIEKWEVHMGCRLIAPIGPKPTLEEWAGGSRCSVTSAT